MFHVETERVDRALLQQRRGSSGSRACQDLEKPNLLPERFISSKVADAGHLLHQEGEFQFVAALGRAMAEVTGQAEEDWRLLI